jgi:hypothetical protein
MEMDNKDDSREKLVNRKNKRTFREVNVEADGYDKYLLLKIM